MVTTSNVSVQMYVKAVAIEGDEKVACEHGTWVARCRSQATHWHTLGTHQSASCKSPGHVDEARLQVAEAFAEEMMDLHGNVPERKS